MSETFAFLRRKMLNIYPSEIKANCVFVALLSEFC